MDHITPHMPRLLLLLLALGSIHCAGPQELTHPGSGWRLTAPEGWTLSPAPADSAHARFILTSPTHGITSRIQSLPSHASPEALRVWLELQLEARGANKESRKDAALARSSRWLFEEPDGAHTEILLLQDGDPILCESRGARADLEATAAQRAALCASVTRPPTTTTETSSPRACDVATDNTSTTIECPEQLMRAHILTSPLPYPLAESDLVAQFMAVHGERAIVVAMDRATTPNTTHEVLFKHATEGGDLVEITHFYYWDVRDAMIQQIAISIPTAMLENASAETLREQVNALHEASK